MVWDWDFARAESVYSRPQQHRRSSSDKHRHPQRFGSSARKNYAPIVLNDWQMAGFLLSPFPLKRPPEPGNALRSNMSSPPTWNRTSKTTTVTLTIRNLPRPPIHRPPATATPSTVPRISYPFPPATAAVEGTRSCRTSASWPCRWSSRTTPRRRWRPL